MKNTSPNSCVHPSFSARFGSLIQGTLAAFDRLRLRGTLRALYHPAGMEAYLSASKTLLKDFGVLAQHVTNQVKQAAEALIKDSQAPYRYLNSSRASKEESARAMAGDCRKKEGLIAVLGCVEPCLSYNTRYDGRDGKLHMTLETRKCMHYYYYYNHKELGFMHVRQQTWVPFQIDICLNGREWLSRQMDKAGLAYQKQDNAIVWVENWAKAQALADEQLNMDWPRLLNEWITECHPMAGKITRPLKLEYYWSASESEYATDLLFTDPKELARLYPLLARHGMASFGSPDVLRFLGKRTGAESGKVSPGFEGEIISDLKIRSEGLRVKHSVRGNSVKMYDKHGKILRVETTIVQPKEFRSWRAPEGNPKGKPAWRVMRRSVADLNRRAEVSRDCNRRYLGALGSTSGDQSLSELAEPIAKPTRTKERKSRALNAFNPEDAKLLEAINRGEFVLDGLRNRDLRGLLYGADGSEEKRKKQSAAVSRKLRILRDHGLLKKVRKSHRYHVTDQGRKVITALLTARNANVDELTKIAA